MTNKKRVLNNRIFGSLYNKVKTIGNLCIYCEQPATVYDHVPPLSKAKVESKILLKIPSCASCNRYLHTFSSIDLTERKKYILEKIYKSPKQRKIINIPTWDTEIKEITGWVKKYIKSSLKKQIILIDRIEVLQKSDCFTNWCEPYEMRGRNKHETENI